MDTQLKSASGHVAAQRPANVVILRANAPYFYSLAVASMLESLAPACAQRLQYFFAADEGFCEWLSRTWLACKVARARVLREYVGRVWPEFDWAAANDQLTSGVGTDGGPVPHRPTAAYEALARCVASAQSAIFYRALSRWADDLSVQEQARAMAYEEACWFQRFRAAYERAARRDRVGPVRAWQLAERVVRGARDTHVQLAFRAALAQWGPNVPFPVIDYLEFLVRLRAVIRRCAEPGWRECLVFRAWSRRPELVTEEARPSSNAAFRPVFKAAA